MVDKSELEARKIEWLSIKPRLEYSKSHTKKELKVFEQYFIKGQEPEWNKGQDWAIGGCEPDPIPLLYRLWFSRDQSQEAWQAILDSVLSTYTHLQILASLQETRNLIYQQACSSSYYGVEDSPIGFMGGLEERIFNFFAGDFASKVFPAYQGQRILTGGFFGSGYYCELVDWLERGEYVNPFNMIQYMQEFWYEGLSDECIKKLVQDDTVNTVRAYLGLVSAFSSASMPELEEDHARITHCRKVRDILESRPIPALLVQWWCDAKSGVPVSVAGAQESVVEAEVGNASPGASIAEGAATGAVSQLIDKTLELIKKYNLAFTPAELGGFDPAQEPYFQWIERLLPMNAVGHAMEQGQAPSSFYPDLFERYVAVTQGEFSPENLSFDSKDNWETLLIEFEYAGKPIRLVVDGVDDSDQFTPNFFLALDGFAKHHLQGRWLDMYDDDDACVSIYLPAVAYVEFLELRALLQAVNN